MERTTVLLKSIREMGTGMKKNRILIIIPAYNEQDNILDTVRDLDQCGLEIDRIVVNDDSVDGTKKILEEYHICHINLPVNLEIGGGVQTGYLYAYENGYEIAVQMDGDGQHCASELEKVVRPILNGEADVVVGSRFLEKEGFQSSFMRRAGIRFLSWLVLCCTGQRVHDVTSGFRAVNRKYIEVFSKEYAQDYPEPEAIVAVSKRHGRIKEVPVVMKERRNGESSISAVKSVYYMVKVSLAIIFQKISG